MFVAIGLRSFVFSCNNLRQDELDCEQAVVRLAQCCPGLQAREISCYYSAGSCEESDTLPDIDITESRCIRERSCEALSAAGICQRATEKATSFYPRSVSVCP